MQARVRDLYKRILVVGKDYPLGLAHVREKAKAEFFKQKDLQEEVQIKQAVSRGRWMVKEMIGVIQLKKYRTMNKRYTPVEMHGLLRTLHEEASERLKKEEGKEM